MAESCGAWCGSSLTEEQIEKYRRSRLLPTAGEVAVRLASAGEISPVPQDGERVVFLAHLMRGLAFPASAFFLTFVAHFYLRLYHLGPNAISILAHFVAFCECYLRIQPDLGIFCRLFLIRPQVQYAKGALMACGGASIYSRAQIGYPKFKLHDTVMLLQQTYFYVHNLGADDHLNLPGFQDVESTRVNWEQKHYSSKPEAEELLRQMRALVTAGLTGVDVMLSWASRLMMPLQQRAHKMCYYSGRLDLSRLSHCDTPLANLYEWVWMITKQKIKADWCDTPDIRAKQILEIRMT